VDSFINDPSLRLEGDEGADALGNDALEAASTELSVPPRTELSVPPRRTPVVEDAVEIEYGPLSRDPEIIDAEFEVKPDSTQLSTQAQRRLEAPTKRGADDASPKVDPDPSSPPKKKMSRGRKAALGAGGVAAYILANAMHNSSKKPTHKGFVEPGVGDLAMPEPEAMPQQDNFDAIMGGGVIPVRQSSEQRLRALQAAMQGQLSPNTQVLGNWVN